MKEDLLHQNNNLNNSVGDALVPFNNNNNNKGCSICKCPHHHQEQQHLHLQLQLQQMQLQQLQIQNHLYITKNNESLVKLNVGGKRYITTRDTLLSKGENFFSCLISGSIPSFKDEKGYIFIDRNGSYFNYILEYLRTGYVDIPPQDIRLDPIFREADFYCIHGFQLQWLAQQLHKSAAVSRAASSSRLTDADNEAVNNVVNIINDVNNHHHANNNNTTVRRRQLSNQDLRWSLGALVERLLKI